nr:PREDICTED: serine/arginine-rich splicing factor SC35-like [Bemisia tabaci]
MAAKRKTKKRVRINPNRPKSARPRPPSKKRATARKPRRGRRPVSSRRPTAKRRPSILVNSPRKARKSRSRSLSKRSASVSARARSVSSRRSKSRSPSKFKLPKIRLPFQRASKASPRRLSLASLGSRSGRRDSCSACRKASLDEARAASAARPKSSSPIKLPKINFNSFFSSRRLRRKKK